MSIADDRDGILRFSRVGHRSRAWVGVACLVALVACSRPSQETALIQGTVTSTEAVTLPPAAVLELRLERTSDSAAPPELLAVQRQSDVGRLPVQFTLEYEPSAVNPDADYGISVRVLLGEDVLLASERPVAVLSGGASDTIEIEIAPVSGPAPSADAGRSLVTGTLELGDTSASYRAVVADDTVERIDEEFDLGDYGAGQARYLFDGARLARYEESSSKRLIDPDEPEKLVEIVTTLEFDAAGQLVRSSKTMDAASVDVSAADVSGARNRADLLRSRVLAQYAGQSHRSPHDQP